MKHRNRARPSSLFLMELILAILFFSLASAVCVQFFVKSHILSRDAQIMNHAVNECSGIAEIVNASDEIGEAADVISAVYPDAAIETTEESGNLSTVSVLIYYDEEFALCTESDGIYILQAALWEQGRMLTTGMTMGRAEDDAPIYELTVKHYLQRRIGHAER